MEIKASDLSPHQAYELLTSVIVPRPIAWISTVNNCGQTNLAPFSFFMGVGSEPPALAVSFVPKRDGSLKDTLRNIHETKVFCVNLVEEPMTELMHISSGTYEPDVSEFNVTGLLPVRCATIDCVRVQRARVSLECRMIGEHIYGTSSKRHIVVGEVLHAYLADEIVAADSPKADINAIRPVGRVGNKHYAFLKERFSLINSQ